MHEPWQLGLWLCGLRGGVRTRPGPARGADARGPPAGLVRALRQARGVALIEPTEGAGWESTTWSPDWTDAQYAAAVACVRGHIAAGETYQCNLTDRFRATVPEDPLSLYAQLALAQQGSYNAFLDIGDHVIASASPELFFEWTGDEIRTRPMKGTAPRGRTTAEDAAQSHALRASSKERAENLMIVDLLRNDLGRIAEIGSVRVDELFALERYPTLWQMTSQVTARLRAGTGLLDVFQALFPCGSITGAPKRRTMALIRELEPGPRGVYCGAVGLLAPPSAAFRARFSVAIRTAVIDQRSGEAVYGAGGGITWGSDPARERAELRTKAAVLVHEPTEHQLVETLAATPAEGLRNVDRHLDRMADSARWFDFRFDRDAVLEAVKRMTRDVSESSRIRIVLSRDGGVDVECTSLRPAREAAPPATWSTTSPSMPRRCSS